MNPRDETGPYETGPDETRHDEIGPVFAEPWHAQLFAVTHALASSGHFAWSDWSVHFSAALAVADDTGAAKDGSAYYDVWLAAFEDFLIARGLADATGLADIKHGWTEAYRATPHGAPVELRSSRPTA